MSKGAAKAKAKIIEKENIKKKARLKKVVIVIACALVIMVVLGIALNSTNKKKNAEIYSYLGQTILLYPDGKFTAALAHNANKSGTYTKTTESGRINVSFNINGRVEVGWIINNNLHLPREWDDGHGHGNIFPKQN